MKMTIRRALATAAVAVALIGGGMIMTPTASADEWEGPIDAWTTFPISDGQEICHTTGQIGVIWGAYKDYECRDDGWFTTYLYVQYYP